MSQTRQPVPDREYEAEVVATVWQEQDYTSTFSKSIVSVTLSGSAPDTTLTVHWTFAGENYSHSFALYYSDPIRKGEHRSATDRAIGILEVVSES